MAEDYTELFTRGMHSGPHPSLFPEGACVSMWNVVYPSTQRTPMPGPKFVDKGTMTVDVGLEGLAYTEFSNGSKYLWGIDRGNNLKRADISGGIGVTPGDTQLTWGSNLGTGWISGVTNQTTLVPVHYNDVYYFFTGLGSRNIAIDSDGSVRGMGLLNTTAPPGYRTATGVWPPQNAPGYFEYWTTEVVLAADGTVLRESAVDPSNGILSVYVPNNTTQIIVRRGYSGKVNTEATHWRLYRSVRKDSEDMQAFPNGNLLTTLPFTNAAGQPLVEVQDTVPTSTPETLATSATSAATGSWTVNNPGNITATDGVFATMVNTGAQAGTASITATFPAAAFTGIVDPIKGIEVKITGKMTGNYEYVERLLVELAIQDWPALWGAYPFRTPSFTGTNTTMVIGGPDADWRRIDYSDEFHQGTNQPIGVISAAQFTSANFKVRIFVASDPGASGTISIDDVRIKVYHGGTTALTPKETGTQEPYEFISVAEGGDLALVSVNDPPPVATCGAVFNDMMVVDSVNERGTIRWSVPGKPESFPAPYFYQFITPQNDAITGMWVLGNKLLVATHSSLWRINYLPTEADVQFQRGPMADLVDGTRGIAGPLAASTYISSEGRPELMFTDGESVRSTDGYVTHPVLTQIDLSGFFRQGRSTRRKTFMLNDVDYTTMYVCCSIDESGLGYVPSDTLYNAGYVSEAGKHSMVGVNYGPAHAASNGSLTCSGFLHSTTEVFTSGDNVKFPACGVVIHNPALIPAWAAGNSNVIFVGFSSVSNNSGYNGSTLGRVAWLAPRNALKQLSPNITPNLAAGSATSVIITRPFAFGGLGGEFRLNEIYLVPRLEFPLTVSASITNSNLTTSQTATYPLIQPSATKINPKQIINRFGQMIQLKFLFDTSLNADFFTSPSDVFGLLDGVVLRWEPYGRENR